MKSLFLFCVAALFLATQVSARARKQRPRVEDHVNGILCDTCTQMITRLDELLKVDQDQIVATLTSLCDDLRLPGNMSAECKELVEEYVPVIFEMIESMDPQELCTEIGMCSSDDVEVTTQSLGGHSSMYHNSLRKFKAIDQFLLSIKERIQQNVVKVLVNEILRDNVVCDGCKETVQFIHDLLTCNETLDDIVQALEMVCNYLPEEFRKTCDDYIELIPEILITIADTYFIPDEDCKAIGLCSGEDEVLIPDIPEIDVPALPEIPELLPEVPELPEIPAAVQHMFPGFDSFSKPIRNKKKHLKRVDFKPRRFLRAIPKYKGINKTKKPKNLPKVVTKYSKGVQSVGTDPEPIITDIAVKKDVDETWECKLCAHIVKTLAEFIGKYRDQYAEAIIDNVTQFCDRLPSPYSTKCTAEVKPYLNKIELEFAITYYVSAGKICPIVIDNCNP